MVPIVPSSGAGQQASDAQGNLSPEIAEKILNSDGVHLLKIDYAVVDGQFVYLEYNKIDKLSINLCIIVSFGLSLLVLRYLIADSVLMWMLFITISLGVALIRMEVINTKVRNSVNYIPITEAIKRELPPDVDVISINFDWYHDVVRVYYVKKKTTQHTVQSPAAS